MQYSDLFKGEKPMKKKLSIPILTIVLVLVLVTPALAISNGQPDDDGRYPYVGIVLWPIGGGWWSVCSGAAISPNVLVTAAHCFEDWDGEPVYVNFVPDVGWSSQIFDEAVIGTPHSHPDFCIGCAPGLPGFDTHDVAVVVFNEPVILDSYANLPTEGLVDTLPMNEDVTLVGYGDQWDTGGGPRWPSDGFATRYFAFSQLIASNHKKSDEYIKLSANPAQGKGGDCFGDSGGPNLLGDTDTIISITSYGTNGNCAGFGYSNRIDLAYALDFINSFLP
jgi:hypothetical protein